MSDREDVEKIRQEIMRFRELLTLMRGHLESGERAYERLFARFSAEERAGVKEKDLQWKTAESMTPEDVAALGEAAGRMRFYAHDMELNFEQLYDTIMAGLDGETG